MLLYHIQRKKKVGLHAAVDMLLHISIAEIYSTSQKLQMATRLIQKSVFTSSASEVGIGAGDRAVGACELNVVLHIFLRNVLTTLSRARNDAELALVLVPLLPLARHRLRTTYHHHHNNEGGSQRYSMTTIL